jgi:hypothetical protein
MVEHDVHDERDSSDRSKLFCANALFLVSGRTPCKNTVLPESLKFRLVMARKCGPYWSKAETVDDAMRTIPDSSLLDRAMFSALFPDATIIPEKLFGITKSLMAVRKNFGIALKT